jgi:protein-L-isoaspartate(D-aspartate) O-methyltransferase
MHSRTRSPSVGAILPATARLAAAIWYNPAVTLAWLASRIVGVSFARFGRASGSCLPEAKKSVAAFANRMQAHRQTPRRTATHSPNQTAESTMNFEQARFNMIEQQIRPWEVLDQDVLNLLSIVKRENFVPAVYHELAFVDFEVPLPAGQHMLAPRVEARVLQELAVKKHESVLEIGAGSGYMAALLAHRSQHVLTVDIEPELAELARNNLIANGVLNAEVVTGDASRGWAGAAPYDVICVSGGLPVLPQEILEHLKIGGRLAAFVGTAPVMKAQIITRIDEKQFRIADVFETYVEPLTNAVQAPRFKF